MSSSSPFGPTFRKIREARGLSLKEVAADIVSPQFLSQFERSQKEWPSRPSLASCCLWGWIGTPFVPLSWLNYSKFQPHFDETYQSRKHGFSVHYWALKSTKNHLLPRRTKSSGNSICVRLKSMSITRWEKKSTWRTHLSRFNESLKKCRLPIKMKLSKTSTIALLSVLSYEVVAKIRKESLELLKAVILPTLPMRWPLCC